MKCPSCSSLETGVVDSRPRCDSSLIYRRRRCPACLERFSTYEIVAGDRTLLVAPGCEPVEVDPASLATLLTPALRDGLAGIIAAAPSMKARP